MEHITKIAAKVRVTVSMGNNHYNAKDYPDAISAAQAMLPLLAPRESIVVKVNGVPMNKWLADDKGQVFNITVQHPV